MLLQAKKKKQKPKPKIKAKQDRKKTTALFTDFWQKLQIHSGLILSPTNFFPENMIL